jgi:hypothetical protein
MRTTHTMTVKIGILLLLGVPLILQAQTIITVPGTYATLSQAIANADAGSTIQIGPGTYQEQLVISKNLTLIGSGWDKTILREAVSVPDSTALCVNNATVTMRDLQLYGSASWQGGRKGLVAINSAVTMRHCAVVQCYNVSVAAINGSLDVDTLLITCVYGGSGALVVDSTAIGGCPSDLGILIVNTQFHINHLTGGADIDHIINIQSDASSAPAYFGLTYAIDSSQYPQGTIENSTFFGSIDAYYGQGIRIFGAMNHHQSETVIRNNRFRGMVRDSTDAMPNMLTTAGISFNGWTGYAEIYGNTIQHFNTGICLYGIASASIHDNTIADNGRYGIVTSWSYPAAVSDLGGGVYGSPGNNRLYHNGQFGIYHRNALALSAQNNYWGTTDTSAIDALIYDHADASSLGVVNFGAFILPVELTEFTATSRGGSIVLQWTTADEVNNAGFEVERKSNDLTDASGASSSGISAKDWMPLEFVAGHGSSSTSHRYAYIDTPGSGKFLYRLKQIDRDGGCKYSPVREAAGMLPTTLTLEQNYPNPFNPSTSIGFTLAGAGRTSLKVFDMLGREVSTIVDRELEAGTRYLFHYEPRGLSSGLYYYRLKSGGLSLTRTLSIVK